MEPVSTLLPQYPPLWCLVLLSSSHVGLVHERTQRHLKVIIVFTAVCISLRFLQLTNINFSFVYYMSKLFAHRVGNSFVTLMATDYVYQQQCVKSCGILRIYTCISYKDIDAINYFDI
jgi:hypothetical protein